LQLKLHIPGNPKYFGENVFDHDSPTFNKGEIGSFMNYFSDEAYKKFYDLPQDFVQIMGYDFDYPKAHNFIPKRSLEFRTRPLIYSEANFDNTQILVERKYLGHNISRFNSNYYAIPIYLRLPLENQRCLTLKLLTSDKNLSELKKKMNRRSKISRFAWKLFWHLYFGVGILFKRIFKRCN
jgi:hypothetical protein